MATVSKNGSAYQLSGPEDAPLLVLIHGLGLNMAIWDDFESILSNHYRVLRYDLYGHGASQAPPVTPDLTLFAQQLRELMDELDLAQGVMVGFSLGGMINRRLAMDYPQRVLALAILNSPHERSAEGQRLVEQRALDSESGGPGATLDATIERWFTAEFRQNHADYIDQVRGWVLANDPVSYALCRHTLAFGVVELIRPEPPITHPSLVMTCENDSGSTPAMSQAIASEIDGAEVIIAPELQHMGLSENPGFFIDALEQFIQTRLKI